MRDKKDMHSYQHYGVKHILRNPGSGLFIDMGLGKTIISLTAINEILYNRCLVTKVLVIAPLKVAQSVWDDEIKQWAHINHLTISKILGPVNKRLAAIKKHADIYVINRENLVWLVTHFQGYWPYKMVVVDELSSFKSAKSARFKAFRQVRPLMQYVCGLTGTPSPNGLHDLWSQLYMLDQGERLGKTLGEFRKNYFVAAGSKGHIVYKYELRDKKAGKQIYEAIGDICVSMQQKDYLDLPPKIDHIVKVELPEKVKSAYKKFEREKVIEFTETHGEVTAANAAVLVNKLIQFANGAIYDDDGDWHKVHDEKLNALDEIIEAANGEPVMVFYLFKSDKVRILERFKKYKPEVYKDETTKKRWNERKIKILISHPASTGHGLNLQLGGNIIVWFGVPWSLELYLQACKRIHRQGLLKPLQVYHILCKATRDALVMSSLKGKNEGQNNLLDGVKALVKDILKNKN